jgi:hypothetical protein
MKKFRKVSDFVEAMEQLRCSQLRTESAKHCHKVRDFAERVFKFKTNKNEIKIINYCIID